MTRDDDLGDWFEDLFRSSRDHDEAVHQAYQQLENAGLIDRVVVHRFICRQCGPRLTVIRVGGRTLARSKDYKFGRGKNLAESVPEARRKNTLDGNRHWPGHTYDVDRLAELGPDAALTVACRHVDTSVRAVDVLATAECARPGHPGKPTQL